MVLGIAAASINKLFYKILSAASNWPKELRREGKMTVDSPGPVVLELSNPRQRILTIPARLNSLPATAAETLWVLAGRDDMDFLSFYLKRALDFSDDGEIWRAAYGPRLRGSGYKSHLGWGTDQLKEVINELIDHPSTRRAVIGLLNPVTDHENFTAKDFPCTQTLHFIPRGGHLDLVIFIRSNDILWGLTGVNIYEFTVLHELVADMTGIPMGKYYHIADSLHYYTNFQERIDKILQSPHFDIYDYAKDPPQTSDRQNIEMIDSSLKEFMAIEYRLRKLTFGFSHDMGEALETIKRLPLPLPDMCRCVLIYLAIKYWRQDHVVMCCTVVRSILHDIRDSATKISMIEWLTRQKSIDKYLKTEVMKEIPEHLRANIGVFIKEEKI